ncbi:hypothetical protein EJB05_26453, partial [Eragrostis curvula]
MTMQMRRADEDADADAASMRGAREEETKSNREERKGHERRVKVDETMASSLTPVSDEEENEKKQKKKKLCVSVMPPEAELVEVLLNYKACSPSKNEALAALVEEDSDDKHWKDTVTLFAEVEDILRRDDDPILPAIEKLRHDLETKGCITYEVTHDDEL